jgi:hypothetical protein
MKKFLFILAMIPILIAATPYKDETIFNAKQ